MNEAQNNFKLKANVISSKKKAEPISIFLRLWLSMIAGGLMGFLKVFPMFGNWIA